jgi:hypothetical protein
MAILLRILLIPASVQAQRLDELTPPSGQPICDPWYREPALPKFGWTPDLIDEICSGQLPKVNSGPYCGGLAGRLSRVSRPPGCPPCLLVG